MPCDAQRNSDKKTLSNSMSTSQAEPCAQAQLEETSCVKDESRIHFVTKKLMPMNLKDTVSTKAANRDTRSIWQTCGHNSMSLKNLIHLPTPIPKAKKIPEARVGSCGQGMGKIENLPAWQNPE